jgi:S-adenosylmethionine:tRNA ribosyltransferase-isomerase
MLTAEFDYQLPGDLIAQVPVSPRDQSRLMVLHRSSGRVEHQRFADLPRYLARGDVLVLNNSRVIPARLRAVNVQTGGRFEILLLEENRVNDWWAMLRPGKRARLGTRMALRDRTGAPAAIEAVVRETNGEGHRRLAFAGVPDLREHLEALGEVPLPPYITRANDQPKAEDAERYQTVYARAAGSVAAPTAGLHFTPDLLQRLEEGGVRVVYLTLHVGLGTFAPVKADTIAGHVMHEERYELGEPAADAIREAKRGGRRVWAAGTTSVRVLETLAARGGDASALSAGSGRTRIFIHPPYDFRVVDGMLTNFHLPRSTLLMLVSAFASPRRSDGIERVRQAYAEAIRERYRFFSYGDAMLLI